MSVVQNNLLLASDTGGYTIARSVRLRSSETAYFNRTFSAGNRTLFTFSTWVKRGALTGNQNIFGPNTSISSSGTYGVLRFVDGNIEAFDYTNGTSNWYLTTTPVYRDPSAWYHIVITYDSAQATASNRVKLYVNGIQVTAFSTATYPSSSYQGQWNNNLTHYLGTAQIGGSNQYLDGYLTEINFIDGQALTPSSFGETDSITGVWKPKAYSGTYGTNGFYLNFSDNSNNTAATIGKDYSGNGNNWTPNIISVTSGVTYDSMVDSPTVGSLSSNYCVLNPLNATSASGTNLSNGNLQINGIGAGNVNEWLGTMGVSSGKWYYEVTMGENNGVVGISQTGNPNTYPGGDATSYGYSSSIKYNNNTSASYGASLTGGDVVGVAYDLDAGTITFYKNGTSQGQAYSGLSGNYFPAVRAGTTGAAVSVNFGQRPFTYTPPTGFVALNTYNLPASTIKNGAAYMAATLYAGTSVAQNIVNTVNGVSFQPDLVWGKNRSNVNSHRLTDVNRGVGKVLFSDGTAGDTTGDGQLSSFNSNGFGLTGGAGAFEGLNQSGNNYVAWQWKAGTTSASNTNGTITSTVSVGATQGFSVVTYTTPASGTFTVGHGLGVAPSFIINRIRTIANNWYCYHVSLGNNTEIVLNTTAAATSAGGDWNSTTPTSTVFSMGTGWASSYSMVSYCFAAVAGYSAFGSYTGNGSTDGPFVYLGFRPRYILVKCSSSTEAGEAHWECWDTSRTPYNVSNQIQYLDLSTAESTSAVFNMDILSNGFKLRPSAFSYGNNASGQTYIYAAFAENPMKYALAR